MNEQSTRAIAWAIFFLTSTIREKKESSGLEADALRADLMLKEFDKRFPKEKLVT
jgi:hypothetical protein